MTIACKQQPLKALRHWSRICGLSGILALALAWFVFCIKPLQSREEDLRAGYLELDAIRSQRTAMLDALNNAKASNTHWRELESQWRQRANDSQDDVTFLNWANQVADEVGLHLDDYRPAGRERFGEYQGRGLMFSAGGSLSSVLRFFDRLRTCPQMNRITTLEITPTNTERTEFSVSFRVLLFTLQPKTT